ncbi:hypothetical protein RV11_GL002414 [Enterococcus phoeniculicola]|jgi:hypothetical protein|uniref:Uncharacterized protein n=1 Tax=Enterococcus phoeniculicola ATCC BAA-412 TaxID=1158610 RepID=R3WS59_9ENTE|nr:hypothetical protein [Enterococcus phoeniculicola]EOL44665.1 hypothetical protein UC3_01482 [Enterococcus phoeniculicola ATCC BAA-412]EOT74954.1 hypothetical protein I589_02554 [Enterococcus phoeniculicola ATCC BAA-412]OJG72840.1 hypothetical protein RV11_GL002414 [Enterococcus phoeniculicola]
MKKKLFWILCILADLVLLVIGFIKSNFLISMLALGLILFIKQKSYPLLFQTFDEEWDKKRAAFKAKRRENYE